MSMLRLIAACAAAFGLCACSLAPQPAEPSWADSLLAGAPPGEPPATVQSEPLPAALRQDLLRSAVRLQMQGASVRDGAASLQEAEPDTEAFVSDARERGRPPEPQ